MTICVIAEIGVCHDGSLDTALQMIRYSKWAGADCAKFQLFDADKLGRPEIRHLQFSRDQILECRRKCIEEGIEFLCTPFDAENLLWLAAEGGVKRLKISSGGIFNRRLLQTAAETRLPVILSTGMAEMSEIDNALRILKYTPDVTLMHCVSSYPLNPENANLSCIRSLRSAFGIPVGYSDHSAHPDVLFLATALGARTIEAHVTLDRALPGPDHLSAFEFMPFQEAIERCRTVDVMVGNGSKKTQQCEMETRRVWAND